MYFRVLNFFSHLFEVFIEENILRCCQISLVLLILESVQTLTGFLVEIKPFITLSALILIEIPKIRLLALGTLNTIEITLALGALWILTFIWR